MKGARIWHNHQPVGDVVEYIPNMLYGVMDYPPGVADGDVEHGRWLATQMSQEEVHLYLDWCWRECDRLIWNAWLKKPEDKEWLPGDEDKDEFYDDDN